MMGGWWKHVVDIQIDTHINCQPNEKQPTSGAFIRIFVTPKRSSIWIDWFNRTIHESQYISTENDQNDWNFSFEFNRQ